MQICRITVHDCLSIFSLIYSAVEGAGGLRLLRHFFEHFELMIALHSLDWIASVRCNKVFFKAPSGTLLK